MSSKIKLQNYEIHEIGNDLIQVTFWDGKLAKYACATDLRAFYMELHNFLVNNKSGRFVDMLGTPDEMAKGDYFDHQVKFGEHFDMPKFLNRQGDMFERKFVWNKFSNGMFELEMEWFVKAPMPYSGTGWVEIKFDLICRNIKNVEVLEGNTKKVLQQGTWEFRNRVFYKNRVFKQVINNIPIVKNSDWLKIKVFNYFFLKRIEDDLNKFEFSIKPQIQLLMDKYFAH